MMKNKKKDFLKDTSYTLLLDELGSLTTKPADIDSNHHSLSNWQNVRTKRLSNIRYLLNVIQTRHKNIYDDVSFFKDIFSELDALEKEIVNSFSIEKEYSADAITTFFTDKTKDHIELTYTKINSFISRSLTAINEHRVIRLEPIDFKEIENRKIFVVHGRNHKPIEDIKKVLKKESIEPIVLMEEVTPGSDFILNKFLNNADKAKAAIILATGDVLEADNISKHARPNVVLELGYFIGVLSLDRIIVLIEDESVLPSDIKGIEYLNINSRNWKSVLIKKLVKIGF